MKQVRKLPVLWGIQLVAWLVTVLTIGLAFPYTKFPHLWTGYIIPAIYLQWGIYVGLTVVSVKSLFTKIRRREKLKPFEKWILTICATIFMIFAAYVWAYTGITKGSYISGPIYFSVITYLVIFILLYRKRLTICRRLPIRNMATGSWMSMKPNRSLPGCKQL